MTDWYWIAFEDEDTYDRNTVRGRLKEHPISKYLRVNGLM
jgi:hypothetical protein